MLHILTAAGGNPTALLLHDSPKTRSQYAALGDHLMTGGGALLGLRGDERRPEQAGFVLAASRHLEMAGGELCGNATLSAAALLGAIHGQDRFSMTTSDSGRREVAVRLTRDGDGCWVDGVFSDLPLSRAALRIGNQSVSVVDMGGIVHVLIEADFPADYRLAHRRVTDALHLNDRPAVGVSWFYRDGSDVVIEPVVRVLSSASETIIHESACGSASIALATTTGCTDIVQPTGQRITVHREGTATTLRARIHTILTAQLS